MAVAELNQLAVSKIPTTGPHRPLTESEIREWLRLPWGRPHHRGNTRPDRREIIATAGLLAGLDQNEIAHLHEGWLVEKNGITIIRIPKKERCRCVEEPPCFMCTERESNMFEPRPAARQVPVGDNRLASLLQSHYALYEPIGSGIYKLSQNIREKRTAEMDREIRPYAFRHTFGIALAAKGFDDRQILDVLGYKREYKEYGRNQRAAELNKLAETEYYSGLEDLGTGAFRP